MTAHFSAGVAVTFRPEDASFASWSIPIIYDAIPIGKFSHCELYCSALPLRRVLFHCLTRYISFPSPNCQELTYVPGLLVTSSRLTARIESIPNSYDPSMPLFPPSREIPMVRMRSRSISIRVSTISPEFVRTKESSGILNRWVRTVETGEHKGTYKYILPFPIIPLEI